MTDQTMLKNSSITVEFTNVINPDWHRALEELDFLGTSVTGTRLRILVRMTDLIDPPYEEALLSHAAHAILKRLRCFAGRIFPELNQEEDHSFSKLIDQEARIVGCDIKG